jgi:excisionase family DNA binding protein
MRAAFCEALLPATAVDPSGRPRITGKDPGNPGGNRPRRHSHRHFGHIGGNALEFKPVLPEQRSSQPGPGRRSCDRVLLTVEEAADALRIGRSMMYELIAAGAIQTVRVGRLRRITPSALRAYVASLSD